MGTLVSLALLSCMWTAVSEPVLPMRAVETGVLRLVRNRWF